MLYMDMIVSFQFLQLTPIFFLGGGMMLMILGIVLSVP